MMRASFAQHGMWLTERAGLAASAYHMPLPVHVDGPLDRVALRAACEAVVARHPLLGSAFAEQDETLHLVSATRRPTLQELPESSDVEEALRLETLRPFDLAHGPLIRFTLAQVGPQRHVLLIVAHHLVFDGESKDILLRDLAAAYNGAALAPLDPPAPAEVESLLPRAREYWSSHWREPGDPVLPGVSGAGPAAQPGVALTRTLAGDGYARLVRCAQSLGVTRFELLLAAWAAVLRRYGNQQVTFSVDLGTRTEHDSVGLHVNELPLTVPVSSAQTAESLALEIRARLRELYPLRTVPLSQATGVTPRAALTPLSVSYRRRRPSELDFSGLSVEVDWSASHHSARNALHLHLVDDDAQLTLRWDAPTRADRIAGHFASVLHALCIEPSVEVGDLPLLDAEERRCLVYERNLTDTVHSGVSNLRDLVLAHESSEATAIVCGDRTLSYRALCSSARQLAAHLRGLGVVPGDLVAVNLRRSPDLLVALLGVFCAGAAYLPLDPEHPQARLDFILADATPKAVVTEELLAQVAEQTVELPPLAASDLAYVIYTSGSTGRPKGVEVEHGSVVNLLHTLRDTVGSGQSWLATATASFDMSIPELWLPLISGGTVALATEQQTKDGEELLKLIRKADVTHVHVTPSTWRRLLEAGFDEPQVTAMAGAEPLAPKTARQLVGRCRELWNLYGPTETTVWSTAWRVQPECDSVAIGRPLANTRVYVLDAEGRLLPDGVPGELYIGGAGVARGYLRRAELTRERFVPDTDRTPGGSPVGSPSVAGGRMYRTGDVVRWRADGQLEFLGRADDQVKLRGYRIELGEIEARLLEFPGVRAAAAAIRGDDPDEALLVGYVTGIAQADQAELRRHMAQSLPAYLVPSIYIVLHELPSTANGKLDRAALPGVEPVPSGQVRYTGLAEQVYQIWREVLGHGDIGPDDNLFTLGGHSLSVTMISARLRQRLKLDLPLHVFFERPTISGIVEAAGRLQA